MKLAGTPRPGDVLAGRYRIQNRVATGGFGQLYVAEQLAMGRLVAVKRIHADLVEDPTALERFQLEARAACRATHPNLVVYHDFGEDETGTPFLVMEYIQGRTLSSVLRATPELPPARAVHIVEQMCAALGAAHDADIVHRDLKPGNVMLLRQGEDADFVKIIDFGILKRTGTLAEGRRDITRTDEIVGTPEYLAPEIIRGEAFDGRVDQYGVAVMLWEMLVGRRPFQGKDVIATLMAHAREEAPPLEEATQGRLQNTELDRVLQRAMDKAPARRFPSMAAFAKALRAAVGTEVPTATPATKKLDDRKTRRLPPSRRRARLGSALAVLGLLVVLAAIGVLVWPSDARVAAPGADAGGPSEAGEDASATTPGADAGGPSKAGEDASATTPAGDAGGPREADADAGAPTTGADTGAVTKKPVDRKARGFGTLMITVVPFGQIRIDGEHMAEQTHFRTRVRAGRHLIEVGRSGKVEQRKKVTVSREGTKKVTFKLAKETP